MFFMTFTLLLSDSRLCFLFKGDQLNLKKPEVNPLKIIFEREHILGLPEKNHHSISVCSLRELTLSQIY